MITIKSRFDDSVIREVSGHPITLKVGKKSYRFILQYWDLNEEFYSKLTHRESGRGVLTFTAGRLHIAKVEAKKELAKLIEKHGIDRVTVVLNSAEVLNP